MAINKGASLVLAGAVASVALKADPDVDITGYLISDTAYRVVLKLRTVRPADVETSLTAIFPNVAFREIPYAPGVFEAAVGKFFA